MSSSAATSDVESGPEQKISNGDEQKPVSLNDSKTLLYEKTKLTLAAATNAARELHNKDAENANAKDKIYGDVHQIGRNFKETSYLETLMNLIKGYFGCGMLAMGMAYKNGGWLCSTVFLVFFAVVCTYNQHKLIHLATILKKDLKLNYWPGFGDTIGLAFENGQTGFRPFAKFARKLVLALIIVTQLGFCGVYFLFIAKCLQQISNLYDVKLDMRLAIFIILPIIMATAMIGNLKFLAPLSVFANFTIFSGIVIIIYNSMWDLPPISQRKAIGNWGDISLFIGTAIYTFEGISLVLPMQQHMKYKEKFTSSFGILNITMFLITFVAFLLGFVGYMKYGDGVKESLTENLMLEFMSTRILLVCMMLGILCTYALQFYIPVVLIMPILRNSFYVPFSEEVQEYFTRLVLVLLTFLASELIPHLDLFISLIGAVGGSLLALILPSLAYIAERKSGEYGVLCWRLLIDMISITLGVVSFGLGSYFSMAAIINTFAEDLKLK